MSGLVTLEDVLEEIFGELQEEEEPPELERAGDGSWRAAGRTEVAEFNQKTGAKIPAAGSRTLAGLVLSRLGRMPRKGDEVRAHGFLFKVADSRGIIIHRLEISREGEGKKP